MLAKICDAFSCQKRDGTCPAITPQAGEAIELHRKVGLISDSLETSLGSLIDSLQSFRRDSDESPAEFDTRLSKAEAERRNVKLKNEIPPETDLYADPVLIGYVLHNLASNAVKACSEGGMVTMYVPPDGESASIAVSDTGKGMEPDAIGRLFESASVKEEVRANDTARLPYMKPRVLLGGRR